MGCILNQSEAYFDTIFIKQSEPCLFLELKTESQEFFQDKIGVDFKIISQAQLFTQKPCEFDFGQTRFSCLDARAGDRQTYSTDISLKTTSWGPL